MGLYKKYQGKQHYKGYIRTVCLSFILILLSIVVLFPIYYMIVSSFAPAVEGGGGTYSLLPKHFTLDSYKFFFNFSEYSVRWILNSLIVAGCCTITNVLFASLAGYAFAKIRFKGSTILFYLLLIGMMIPTQVTQVPLYMLLINTLHTGDTYFALIAPTAVTCYNIFMAKQFFTSIPTPIIESAKIEGCNQAQIFRMIVAPMSKSILAVIAIMTFMQNWNNFFWPFLVSNKEAMQTIQVGLKNFSYANTTYFAPMMAGATISALPVIILFFSMQKYFLEGVAVGAVKG